MSAAVSNGQKLQSLIDSVQLGQSQSDQIENELTYWLKRGEELKPADRETFRRQIRGYAQEALFRLETLKMSPVLTPEWQVKNIMENQRQCCLLFFQGCESYEKGKERMQNSFASMRSKIAQAGTNLSFASFKPEVFTPANVPQKADTASSVAKESMYKFPEKNDLVKCLDGRHHFHNINVRVAEEFGGSEVLEAGIQIGVGGVLADDENIFAPSSIRTNQLLQLESLLVDDLKACAIK